MRVDGSNAKSESDVTGRNDPEPGRYHMVIKEANDTRINANGEAVNFDLVEYEVLAGDVPGQQGKTYVQRLWLDDSGNEQDAHLRLCLAAGIIRPGEARDINFAKEAPGKQLIVGLEKRKAKDSREYLNVADYGMALWSVHNSDVADVPKDANAMKARGGENASTVSTAPATTEWDV